MGGRVVDGVTMDRDTLLKLAERVEAAQGADRTLDAEIFKAIGAPVPFQFMNKLLALEYNDTEKAYFARVSDDMHVKYSPPAYSASIDAAMTLVPDGTGHDPWWLLKGAWRGKAKAEIWVHNKGKPYRGTASTPALALLAACLRAIAEGEG